MKKYIFNFLTALMIATIFVTMSCTSYKGVPYVQNSEELEKIVQNSSLYEAKVKPKDLLSITVISPKNPAVSSMYNLTVTSMYEEHNNLMAARSLQSYLVDNDGCINFPILGRIHVAGKTKREVEDFILNKIKDSFTEEPIVTMRFMNYSISVLGEVNFQGTFTVKNEKINVFEALALAKDMTIYGRRDNVKLIRENDNGKVEIHELNLNDVSIVASPYYYLQQNDILYVTPNKAKAKNSDVGTSTSLWFSATSILISLVSLLYNILR